MPIGQYVRFKGPLAERMEFRSQRAESGCLEWQGTLDAKGYGVMTIEGRPYRTHRVAYHLSKGPIPADLTVCHTCDNRRCIEPAHLWLGTNADNTADMMEKGRHPCRRGEQHPAATLTNEQVLAIRRDPDDYAEIAKKYALGAGMVSRIKCGHTWRHLPFTEPAVRRSRWGIRPPGSKGRFNATQQADA